MRVSSAFSCAFSAGRPAGAPAHGQAHQRHRLLHHRHIGAVAVLGPHVLEAGNGGDAGAGRGEVTGLERLPDGERALRHDIDEAGGEAAAAQRIEGRGPALGEAADPHRRGAGGGAHAIGEEHEVGAGELHARDIRMGRDPRQVRDAHGIRADIGDDRHGQRLGDGEDVVGLRLRRGEGVERVMHHHRVAAGRGGGAARLDRLLQRAADAGVTMALPAAASAATAWVRAISAGVIG